MLTVALSPACSKAVTASRLTIAPLTPTRMNRATSLHAPYLYKNIRLGVGGVPQCEKSAHGVADACKGSRNQSRNTTVEPAEKPPVVVSRSALRITGSDYEFGALAQFVQHSRDRLRRVAKVGIHHNDDVARGVIHPLQDCGTQSAIGSSDNQGDPRKVQPL